MHIHDSRTTPDHLAPLQRRGRRKIKMQIIIVDDINQKIVKRVQGLDNAIHLKVEPFPVSHHIS